LKAIFHAKGISSHATNAIPKYKKGFVIGLCLLWAKGKELLRN
jgi:hypothetical protein